MDPCEFEASLVYRGSSRTTRVATQRNPVSKSYTYVNLCVVDGYLSAMEARRWNYRWLWLSGNLGPLQEQHAVSTIVSQALLNSCSSVSQGEVHTCITIPPRLPFLRQGLIK